MEKATWQELRSVGRRKQPSLQTTATSEKPYKVDPSVPAKPSNDYKPERHLKCYFLRIVKPEVLAKPLPGF